LTYNEIPSRIAFDSWRFRVITRCLAVALLLAAACSAGVFPPTGQVTDLLYRGEPVTLCYLTAPPTCLTNGVLTIIPPPTIQFLSGNEFDTVNATLDFTLTGFVSGNFHLTGTGQIEILNRPNDNTFGTFNTEMLALDLSGGGLRLRESPTLASHGTTTESSGGGQPFLISSFFDVFTELSLDGGQTWMPATRDQPFDLVPEPASLVLVGGALVLVSRLRKKK
jgi:hypothetical protein